MAKAKREFILGACLFSTVGFVLCIVALSTNAWITGDVTGLNVTSSLTYGLFAGVFSSNVAYDVDYEVKITCLTGENKCAMLCGSSKDERQEQLEKLNNNNPGLTFDTSCPKADRSAKAERISKVNTRGIPPYSGYMSAGSYISTVLFLCLSLVFGCVAITLTIWNTAGNPSQTAFSILGLYVYNGCAAFFVFLATIIWGIEYATNLKENAAIFDTIANNMVSDNTLGYSFWLMMTSMFFYILSPVLLVVRHNLINKEPIVVESIDDARNDVLIMY